MSFLFGRGGKQKPAYTGLQLQTSSSSIPVTIAWGVNRQAPNLIWYDGFKSHKQKKKAGKGAPKQTTYTYTVDVILSIGEGEISGVGKVWQDKDQKPSISDVGLTLFTGSNSQNAWGYLVSQYPDAALAYRQTAYLAAASYDLGDSASLPNHTFEVMARQYNTAVGQHGEADCAVIINEFLFSPQFGVGLYDSRLDATSLMSGPNATTTGDSAYQTYCRAMGFGLSPMLSDQEPARDILSRWTRLTNSELVWTGYSLKFVPYCYANVTNNGVTYLAPDGPVYNLTDDDFVSENEDPIKVDRVGPEDVHNSIKMTINDRESSYNEKPIEWKDQSLIEQYGERAPSALKASEVIDRDMASVMISLYGPREAYVRNTYSFLLGPEFILLEPMDTVTVYDPKLGLTLVQVVTLEEDDDGNLNIEAKQVLNQTSLTSGFVVQPPVGNNQNTGVVASPVNTPIIFEPPANLSKGSAQIWAAVSGGNDTTFDPNWGGCEVFVSTDGVEFQNIGEVDSPARMGKTTAILAAYGGSNPDVANTLSVNLNMSGAELLSVTAGDAGDGVTLCYVGGEFLSYQDTDLTSSYSYDLDKLWRGLYGSTPGSHASASKFARLDENIFTYDLPAEYIGKPLKFKFQSYNIWGQGYQNLSDCVEYDYTPIGTGFAIAAPASVGLVFSNVLQSDGTNIIVGTVTLGASIGPYLDHYDVEITKDGGSTWVAIPSVGATGTKTTFQPALASTNYRARARAVASTIEGIPSAWVQSSIVNSGTLGGSVPNSPTSLVVTPGDYSSTLTFNPPASGSAVAGYRVYAIHGASGSFGSAGLVGTSPSPFFVHSGLGASDTWRYWVVAYNAAGESVELGPVNGTTNAAAGGSSLTVKDEGSTIVSGATILNFTGAGVTATNPSGTQVDIDIPGGGGGGGGDLVLYDPMTSSTFVLSGGAQAGKGNYVTVEEDCEVESFVIRMLSKVVSATYVGHILQVNPTTGAVVSVIASTAVYTATTTAAEFVELAFATAVPLTKGSKVALVFVRTDSSGAAVLPVQTVTGGGEVTYLNAPLQLIGYVNYTNVSITPGLAANSFGTTGLDAYRVGVRVKIPSATVVSKPWYWNPPLASSFTLLNGASTDLILTDDADVGLLIDGNTPVAGDIQRLAVRTLTDPSLDWSMVARMDFTIPAASYAQEGLAFRDSIGGRIGAFSKSQVTTVYSILRFNGYSGYNSQVDYPSGYSIPWFKIEKVGTNLEFSYSADGKAWVKLLVQSVTAWLTNAPSQVGFFSNTNRTSFRNSMSCAYFSLTGPAV